MLDELRATLADAPADAPRAAYVAAIVEHNCLGKPTSATRVLSAQRLSELYALDPDVPLFRIMRNLWRLDERGQPLLALLVALARDPLLAATAPAVIPLRAGEEFARGPMRQALRDAVGDAAERRHAGQGRPQRSQLLEPGRPPDWKDVQGPPTCAANIRHCRSRDAAGVYLRRPRRSVA